MRFIQKYRVYAILAALIFSLFVTSAQAADSDYEYVIASNEVTIVKYIGSDVNVVIPETIGGYPVTTIGSEAFSYNLGVKSLTISDSVTYIQYSAFSWNDTLESIYIGAGVSTIDITAFYEATAIMDITAAEDNATFSSENGVLFDKSKSTIVKFPAAVTGSYTAPDGVESIGVNAFEISSLTEVTFPDSLTDIKFGAFNLSSITQVTMGHNVNTLAEWALGDCSNLTAVYFAGDVPLDVDANAFAASPNVTVYYLEGTEGWESTLAGAPTALWEVQLTEGTYKIINRNSGLALDVAGSSITSGANVLQWTYKGTSNQQWILEPAEDGYFNIVSVKSSKYLSVENSSESDGANIEQNDASTDNSQQWGFVYQGDGYYLIVNRNSGKTVDVYQKSTEAGGNVVQWQKNYGSNQQWKLEML